MERTKLWITGKMKEIMKQKQIDKIRITEICRSAGIERSTFYYHFRDKYDLIAWIFYHDAFGIDVTDQKAAAESMKKMKNEILFYRQAYEDNSQNALWQYIHQYFTDEYTKAAKEKLQTDVLSAQLLFSIRLYCYGTTAMTKEWILDDNVTSAETVVEMMFESMPEVMKSVYFGNAS